MNKKILVMLSVIFILSALLSACGGDDGIKNPCVSGDACGLIAPASDTQQAVTDWLKSTCPDNNRDGYCDTMGQ